MLLSEIISPKKKTDESHFVRSIRGGLDSGANWQDTMGFGTNSFDNEANVAIQLLKNLDLHGKSPIKFQDGSVLNVNSEGSRVVLRALDKLKPKDRHVMTKKISKSKEDFKEFFKSITEEAAGVGIITKQNTTGDVNKDSIRKNLKAFKL